MIANDPRSFIVIASMNFGATTLIAFTLTIAPLVFGGDDRTTARTSVTADEPPPFGLSIESAYLFGAFNPPRNYEISADFLTARLRWGNYLKSGGFFRGYNQIYLSFLAEPFIRGIENHYFGMNLGLRYNFVRPGSRFVPYFSGGVGLGFIDSHPEQFGAQGQDFTFNILSALGVSYQFSNRFRGEVGVLYQHFSNAGQTDPNPSLNLFGPQVGFTFLF